MKRIAIMAFHHSESTLPLAKHLEGRGCEVDYYFVTSTGQASAPALEFGRTVYVPGIRWRNAARMSMTYAYLGPRARVILAVLPPYARRVFAPYSRALFRRLGKILGRGRYDLIVVVGQDDFLVDVHRELGRSGNVYHALHEVAPHYSAQRTGSLLVDRLIRTKANIIVHSRAAKRMLEERYAEAANGNVQVIPFGVFEPYLGFAEADEERMVREPYILFFGTLLPYKGLDVLLAAVRALGEGLGKFKIVVAGAGTDPAVLNMEEDPRFVVMRRYLSNSELVNLVANATSVVCPYTSASQSGIVSTAFLFGKPIIASDVGAFAEFVETGHNGVLTAPGDALALALAMKRMIQDEPFRASAERGARAFATDPRFAWDCLVDRYLALA